MKVYTRVFMACLALTVGLALAPYAFGADAVAPAKDKAATGSCPVSGDQAKGACPASGDQAKATCPATKAEGDAVKGECCKKSAADAAECAKKTAEGKACDSAKEGATCPAANVAKAEAPAEPKTATK